MVVLDGNFALGCGPGMDYPVYIYFNICYNERGMLEPITFVLAYPTVFCSENEVADSS
jgi:hypothetical protein